MPGENTISAGKTEEQEGVSQSITGVETSVTAFIGRTTGGPVEEPVEIADFAGFENTFGELDFNFPVTQAVRDFFQNGGITALVVRLCRNDANEPLDIGSYLGDPSEKTGINALLKADIFNLLSIPPDSAGGDVPLPVYHAALLFCVEKNAMLLVDPPAAWSAGKNSADAAAGAENGLESLGFEGPPARNAALYFPRVVETDPATGNNVTVVPSGIIAGIMANTDNAQGVWKAPAGIDADLEGIEKIEIDLTDKDSELLNPSGINTLRHFPTIGNVVWGARTLRGADSLNDEYKYIPVRRLTLYIQESLNRGLKWTIFEPNGEVLWSSIRAEINAFMTRLLQAGAFAGSFFVTCDATTTTPTDIDQGIVNVTVGFAPVKPAEFVVLEIQLPALPASN